MRASQATLQEFKCITSIHRSLSMPDTLYRPNPDVIATTLEDSESVLLDVKTRRYYSLNETGTRIWELLADGMAVSEIVSQVVSEYDVSEDDARSHVTSLLSELHSEGLIREVEGDDE